MSRRTVAGLLAFGLAVVLSIAALREPVPWVRFQPGPTFDVLHSAFGKQLVVINGHRVYRDDGELRMLTVRPDGPKDKISLFDVLFAWASPDDAVLPKGAVYKKTQTNAQVQQQSAVEMSSSQDNAIAAALGALGVKYRTEVQISTVDKAGASNGILKKGDVVTAVDGIATPDAVTLVKVIRAVTPGNKVLLTVRRGSKTSDLTVVTRPAADDEKSSRINVGIAQKFVFPFEVKFQLGDQIGGPSAGMMFALSIYDLLTPGSLTGGKVVAGTGEINAYGIVGPIGGIGQKLAGAQRDGARLFLAPAENCAEAVRSHFDRNKLRLVKVHTLDDAIKAVDAWRKDPNAALPRCS